MHALKQGEKNVAQEASINSGVGSDPIKLAVRNLNFFYGEKQALFGNTLDIVIEVG